MEKRRINVRGIIWRDGKLLVVKHKTKHGGEADYWAIPGGGLDPHESLLAGVTRELLEETGVSARIGRLLFVQQFASARTSHSEELEFFFLIENPEDFATIDLSTTSHGDAEIARIDFIDPRRERVLPEFLTTIDIEHYTTTECAVYCYTELG